MPTDYRRFLKQNNIIALPAAGADYHPGSVLKQRRRRCKYTQWGRIDMLLNNDKEWPCKLVEANIVESDIKRRLSLQGRASVKEFGLGIGAGLRNATSVTYEITGLKNRVFTNPNVLIRHSDEIEGYIRNNRKKGYRYFVLERLWYAVEFIVKFEGMTKAELKAVLDKHVNVTGDAKFKLNTKGNIVVTAGKPTVPFGFTTWLRL